MPQRTELPSNTNQQVTAHLRVCAPFTPRELPSTVVDERWRPFPLQGVHALNAPFHEEFAGPSRLAARVPGRRIGVARLAEEPVAVPTPRVLHPNPGVKNPLDMPQFAFLTPQLMGVA